MFDGARSGSEDRFYLEARDEAVLLHFPSRPLFFASDLAVRDEVLGAFDRCAQNDRIRTLVLIGFPEKAGSSEYDEFFELITSPDGSKRIYRMLNVFNQFIMAIVNIDKYVIFVDSGRVISQFFNVGLACDHRIVGDDLVVEKSYLRRGLIPKGGGAYFLSKRLGPSRASTLLLSDDDLTAVDALVLGLVDDVVPASELIDVALERASEIAAKPASTVAGIKRLINWDRGILQTFLAQENTEFERIIGTYHR